MSLTGEPLSIPASPRSPNGTLSAVYIWSVIQFETRDSISLLPNFASPRVKAIPLDLCFSVCLSLFVSLLFLISSTDGAAGCLFSHRHASAGDWAEKHPDRQANITKVFQMCSDALTAWEDGRGAGRGGGGGRGGKGSAGVSESGGWRGKTAVGGVV